MIDWILFHGHGFIDWGLVFLSVFGLVLICQGMINFLKDPEDRDEDDD